jgi:hypothetical protein
MGWAVVVVEARVVVDVTGDGVVSEHSPRFFTLQIPFESWHREGKHAEAGSSEQGER